MTAGTAATAEERVPGPRHPDPVMLLQVDGAARRGAPVPGPMH